MGLLDLYMKKILIGVDFEDFIFSTVTSHLPETQHHCEQCPFRQCLCCGEDLPIRESEFSEYSN